MVSPGIIACSFPKDPTVFDYTYCIIYSLICLGALIIGAYLYFKQLLKKKSINNERPTPIIQV